MAPGTRKRRLKNINGAFTEWLTTKQVPTSKKSTVTIRVLVNAFPDHAETYYVKNGRQTGSYQRFELVSKPLLELYGSLLVDEFGPASLKALRSNPDTVSNAR